jgi:hypothetical protein
LHSQATGALDQSWQCIICCQRDKYQLFEKEINKQGTFWEYINS